MTQFLLKEKLSSANFYYLFVVSAFVFWVSLKINLCQFVLQSVL